jgi:hypothetical protein
MNMSIPKMNKNAVFIIFSHFACEKYCAKGISRAAHGANPLITKLRKLNKDILTRKAGVKGAQPPSRRTMSS